jgi:hypothetical protein
MSDLRVGAFLVLGTDRPITTTLMLSKNRHQKKDTHQQARSTSTEAPTSPSLEELKHHSQDERTNNANTLTQMRNETPQGQEQWNAPFVP